MQPCLFVQCCTRIFLVQCQRNLYYVGVVFAATSCYQKINWSKMKITKKWPNVVPRILHWVFFPVQCCLESPGQHLSQAVKSIKSLLTRIFSCAMLFENSWATLHTRFLPLQCCLKSIRTTLNRIFFCSLLSGASRTIMHLGILPVQCCTMANIELFWGKQPMQCCIHLVGTTHSIGILYGNGNQQQQSAMPL